jgi:nucleotide-binding universal stress UspA family protein
MGDKAQPVVVVGIDGSKASSKALAWAADEARMRGAVLRVVHAYRIPRLSSADYLEASTPVEPAGLNAWGENAYESFRSQVVSESEDERGGAEDTVAGQVATVLGDSPDVPVQHVVTEGRAVQVILDAAEDADLVVVGSRGRGGFSGLLLGSVSSQVTHHARCPVTVVHS